MKVDIQKNSVKRIGDQIRIDILIDIYHENLADNGIIEITPVMNHKNKKTELPKLIIQGKKRYRSFRQVLRSLKKRDVLSVYNIYKALKVKPSGIHCVSYEHSIPYENWMSLGQFTFSYNTHSSGLLNTAN